MTESVVLYGTPFSLYTGKVRSYLSYKGIPYHEEMATLGVYKKIIKPKTGVQFIPVVRTNDGSYLQDTTVIIDALEQDHPERSIVPPNPVHQIASMIIELYADEWLLIPAMYYRWRFPKENQAYIEAEFGSIATPWAPAFIRRILGRRITPRISRFVPNLGIHDGTASALEHWFDETLSALDSHFETHRYLLGDRASVGDFGLMGPVYAHWFIDPKPSAILRERAPHVVEWIERMNSEAPRIGAWPENDHIPETLGPLLRRFFEEQLPVLLDTATELATWQEQHPDDPKLPRSIGKHTVNIGGVETERVMLPYSVWMLQRVQRACAALPENDQARVRSALSQFGNADSFFAAPHPELDRRENRVCLAATA